MSMLPHANQPTVGTLVVTNTPWWGLGAMLSSAASWLPHVDAPIHVYCSNIFYKDKTFPPNQFEWFFDQPALSRHFKLVIGRHASVPLNYELSEDLVRTLQTHIQQNWVVKPEFIPKSRPNTLAVHYRGTDKYTETPPTPFPRLFRMIEQNLRDYKLEKLLFCTDDSSVLTTVLTQYPQCEYFPDHLRIDGIRGLHHKLGSYQQARETFIELLAMGACSRLLCSRGCMGDAAIMLAHNPDLTWAYHN